jgi:4-phosphopantoate--beta-alanine ligase
MEFEIPESHPRAQSLKVREMLIAGCKDNVVAFAGLIAHGRGEAFDYLIGEETKPFASHAIKAAAALLLSAAHPVISVNGNLAALTPAEIVELSRATGAFIEINLFYRSFEREQAILKVLHNAGAEIVLGVGKAASASIPELQSERRRVDPEGIMKADVVLVPMEDGDRTEALVKLGKRVIAIDLNPMSRTSRFADITIVDNVTRAMPLLVHESKKLKQMPAPTLPDIISQYDNDRILRDSLSYIGQRMKDLSQKEFGLR